MSAFAFAYAKQEETIYCPQIYDPVCAEVQVYCIKAPCEPIQKTFSNECMARANKNTLRILHKGTCKFEPAKKAVPIGTSKIKNRMPENCKVWFDGCNICSRKSPSSPPICTLRACIGDRIEKAYCREYFNSEDVKNRGKDESKTKESPESSTTSSVPVDSVALKDENFYPYDDARIFFNIKDGDTISSPFNLKGYVNLSKRPNLWSPFERQSGNCKIESKGKVITSFPLLIMHRDWMERAMKGENLWFSQKLNLPEGSYTMNCFNENPSGLPDNARQLSVNFKVANSNQPTYNTPNKDEFKENAKQIETALKKKYKKARIIEETRNFATIEVPKEAKIFGFLPLTFKEVIRVDKKTLKVVQTKRPWWAIFAFNLW